MRFDFDIQLLENGRVCVLEEVAVERVNVGEGPGRGPWLSQACHPGLVQTDTEQIHSPGPLPGSLPALSHVWSGGVYNQTPHPNIHSHHQYHLLIADTQLGSVCFKGKVFYCKLYLTLRFFSS